MPASPLSSPPSSEVVALTRDLVRFETVNPPGNELPAIHFLAERLARAGFATTVLPYGPGRGNLVARLVGSGGRPGLLFSGHVDVVPVGQLSWRHAPFAAELEEGRLYGRGACDMKGGVAALVVAAEALARGERLAGDLVVCITSDEECGCAGAAALVREPLFEGLGAALVAEPTALDLYVAEKGALWLEVRFSGKTAHASMPERGANAIVAAVAFLVRLELESPVAGYAHPLLGPATLNVGTIQGGVKTNVVPDSCTITLDMRSVPGLDHTLLTQRVEAAALAVAAARAGTRAEVTQVVNQQPVGSPPDSPLALATAEAVQEVTGRRVSFGGVPYFTEACIWAPVLRLPIVICGPGDPSLAHQPDEFVPLAELELAVAIYTRVAQRLLRGE